MTTKGQMNPTSRERITASQAGQNSQTNGPEHNIVSSSLTDLIFKRSKGRRAVSSDPPLNQRNSRLFNKDFDQQIQWIRDILFIFNVQESNIRIYIGVDGDICVNLEL
jgi:hypothetical protein